MGHDGERNQPLVWYENNDLNIPILVSKGDKKFSNALAKMLIWFLKSKQICSVKDKKSIKIVRQIPLERNEYKKMEKYFYSFKYKAWFRRTSVKVESATPKGYWYSCLLINEDTEIVLEEFIEVSALNLKDRFLKFINNPLNF